MEKLTINDFKAMVSIVEIIKHENLDFVLLRDGKNINAYTTMKDENGKNLYNGNKPIKKENFLVCRLSKSNDSNNPSYQEVYYNLNDFDRKSPKSVIDFVSEEILKAQPGKIEFGKVFKYLNDYVRSEKFVHINNSSVDFQAKQKSDKPATTKAKDLYSVPEKITIDYLKSRGINCYNTPVFFNTYGTAKGTIDRTMNDKTYQQELNHPAFPLINSHGKLEQLQWINYDQNKNVHTGKYFLEGNRGDSMYFSNFQKGFSNTLIIAESPEKTFAHYQQYKQDLDKTALNPFYTATCGQLTQPMLEHVNSVCFVRRIDQVVTAFDADKNGVLYNLALMTYLSDKSFDYNFNAKQLENNKIEITISTKQMDKNVSDIFKSIDFTKLQVKETNGGMTLSIVAAPKEFLENMKHVSDGKLKCLIHPPISKDFLDDLKEGNKLPMKFDFHKSPKKENSTKIRL